MELRHLRYFVAVAEELNFGRAAKRLHIAQPALSAQVRDLEEELGTRLLERDTRRVALTPIGRAFLAEARAILEKAEQAVTTARHQARGVMGELRVGAITSFTNDPLLRLICDYRAKFPDVEFRFIDRTPAGLESALSNKAVDVAFLRPPIRDTALDFRVVEHAEIVVIMPSTHRLAKVKELTWPQLKQEQFIELPDDQSPGFNARLRDYALKAGFVPNIEHHGHEMHSILWLVEIGLGISAMVIGMKDLLRRDLVLKRFRPPRPTIETLMAWRCGDSSPALREFLQLAERHLPHAVGNTGRLRDS
jgi:DNA-binding transcriptional LysR family regulator